MEKIALKKLDVDPRNANVCLPETLDKIEVNMKRTGLCPALIVRPHPSKSGRYILIDGHHRKLVLERLGWTDAPCDVWDVPETEAILLLATLNRLRGEDNLRKRAELLDNLCQQFKPEELVKLIPESKGELQELLALLRFDEAEMKERIRKATEKEKAELPVILNFVMSSSEAELIQATLNRFQPKGQANPSLGLIALCQSVKPKDEVTPA